jgi:hypothetical protein
VAFGGSAGDVVLVPARAESVVNGEDAAPLPPDVLAEQNTEVSVVATPPDDGDQELEIGAPIDSTDPFIPVVTAAAGTVDVNITVEWPQGF